MEGRETLSNKFSVYNPLPELWVRAIALGQLTLRVLLHGFRPQVRQVRDLDNTLCWYAYYPLSGALKFLASEAEIKQWIELRQDI
ncbi:MAG: hypothetical protein QNJ46_29730 [Leptolyngbyaceae cyanobacterium MO_188.B28]|nr:hypothetical protein [Leptolyngbyaceae cyanobacterium MO_188.B28]